jgi:hypothetical protein
MQVRFTNPSMLIASLGVLAVASASASAAITGVTGAATQIGPPANCLPGLLNGPNTWAWDEQQNRGFVGLADMTVNPGVSSSPTPGAIAGVYDSHFLHYEDYSGLPPAVGTVSFNNPIVAVFYMATTLSLDNTDAPLGAFGTVYPTGYPFRSLNATSLFSISGNTLSFNFSTISPVQEVVQVRVLTAVPSPAGASLLAFGGAAALLRRRRAR